MSKHFDNLISHKKDHFCHEVFNLKKIVLVDIWYSKERKTASKKYIHHTQCSKIGKKGAISNVCWEDCMIISQVKINVFWKKFLTSLALLEPLHSKISKNVDFSLWGKQLSRRLADFFGWKKWFHDFFCVL